VIGTVKSSETGKLECCCVRFMLATSAFQAPLKDISARWLVRPSRVCDLPAVHRLS
jgi:hypothetical protein